MYKNIRGINYAKTYEKISHKAFTLTEVLLAIAIVGIIAALVLPLVMKTFQNKSLEATAKRQQSALELAVKSLILEENVDSYKKTVLYSSQDDLTDYATTSGAFIKKYLKVSRYCGNNNGNCFAKNYYKYEDNDKVVANPTYKGACASLKNGASICMTPQTPSGSLKILIDINGKKGPNIVGRDLRELTVALPDKGSVDSVSSDVAWVSELVEIKPQCSDGETTEECCDTNFVTACCTAFPAKYASKCNNICSKDTGNDAKCCIGDSGSAAYTSTTARKKSCCLNNPKYYDANKTACCNTLVPGDSRCVPPPPKDIDFNVEIACGFKYYPNVWPYQDWNCSYAEVSGQVGCRVLITNTSGLKNDLPNSAAVYIMQNGSGAAAPFNSSGSVAFANIDIPYFSGRYVTNGMSGGCTNGGYNYSYHYPECSVTLNGSSIYLPMYGGGYYPDYGYMYNSDWNRLFEPNCNKTWKCTKKEGASSASCTLTNQKPSPYHPYY